MDVKRAPFPAGRSAARRSRTPAARFHDAEDGDEILRRAVIEAVDLLSADGGLVYTLDEAGPTLRLREDVGITSDPARRWARELALPLGSGMFGRAVADGRVVRTDDYEADHSFVHTPAADRVVAEAGIVSMIVAPLIAGEVAHGALGVYSSNVAAFSEADAALVRALAAHAATTLANRSLIAELERSRGHALRRSERERELRELIASLASVHDTEALLQRIVDAAAAAAGANGALLDRVESNDGTHRALGPTLASHGAQPMLGTPILNETGMMGRALAERRTAVTGDYLADTSFVHLPDTDEFARQLGIHSVVAVPLIADGEPLGVLAAYSGQPDGFDADAVALIEAFADHASLAIHNARRTDELSRSREELARHASAERGLREIAARLASIRKPDEVLQQAVEAVCPLVGGDWAEMARVDPDGAIVWSHVYGMDDPDLRTAQWALKLRVGEGLLGRAASERRPIATGDYLADESFAHIPTSDEFVKLAGFRSLVAAPLIADGAVIGILAVHSTQPHAFDADDVATVGAFADVAAAAMGNARLIEALDASEQRYRGLLAASPDIVFTVDAEGRFTFLSETLERQLGWRVNDMLDKHFSALIDVGSMGDALERWRTLREKPGEVLTARFNLIHSDGSLAAYEVRSSGIAVDSAFVGVQGAARDVSERERLERELRESEERYRYLVKASPDVVWAVDTDGRFTFLSDRLEQLTGYRPQEMLGHHFLDLTDPAYVEPSMETFRSVQAEPGGVYKLSILMPARDGSLIPVDIWVTGRERDGQFAGAHGSIRDMRERVRLERELRESEGRYREIIAASPDMIWEMDADGVFTFVSATVEQLIGHRPDEVVGRDAWSFVHESSVEGAQVGWTLLTEEPGRVHPARFALRHRDGHAVPVETYGIGRALDGRFLGAQGASRDMRERERLEQDLRRQAAELAASEERAHLARELHDSVTQALFSMTLVTRTMEMVMDRDAAAARTHLQTLRELQQDALAEMRALVVELRPAALEAEGLVQALRTHTAALRGRTGLTVRLDVDGAARLPSATEAALFRVAQEALNNVVKHARASSAEVSLTVEDALARLSITDDGVGFDPERVAAGHFGLAGMKDRVERLGGRIEVTSKPDAGTSVRVEVPVGASIGDAAGQATAP